MWKLWPGYSTETQRASSDSCAGTQGRRSYPPLYVNMLTSGNRCNICCSTFFAVTGADKR